MSYAQALYCFPNFWWKEWYGQILTTKSPPQFCLGPLSDIRKDSVPLQTPFFINDAFGNLTLPASQTLREYTQRERYRVLKELLKSHSGQSHIEAGPQFHRFLNCATYSNCQGSPLPRILDGPNKM